MGGHEFQSAHLDGKIGSSAISAQISVYCRPRLREFCRWWERSPRRTTGPQPLGKSESLRRTPLDQISAMGRISVTHRADPQHPPSRYATADHRQLKASVPERQLYRLCRHAGAGCGMHFGGGHSWGIVRSFARDRSAWSRLHHGRDSARGEIAAARPTDSGVRPAAVHHPQRSRSILSAVPLPICRSHTLSRCGRCHRDEW